jgi:hypothetical protein
VVLRRWLVLLAVGGFAAAACSGASGDTGPTAEVTAPPRESTTTTEARTPEEEVEAAYLRSWEVYAKAVRDLDARGLEEVLAEERLETTRQEIQRRIVERRPSRVSVEHRYEIEITEPEVAFVLDRYVNHSVWLDPDTGQPGEPDPNQVLFDVSTLKRIEGKWKVVRTVRQRS